MLEPIWETEKVEPWGRRCRCGEMMRVGPSQARTPLIHQENWRQILTEVGYDYTKTRAPLEKFDEFEHYVLSYLCPSCGRRSTDYEAQFTEEEASEVAARQNTAQKILSYEG